ncbi:hypothetical protein SAMN02745671_00877 [Anaerovibrio lipolyticus DSM 3074]|uniref:Uncharacterized protein n=1 Tax=Anaerovibrio lipolyticus DSM 3074 TaxID=1120997 RepID=A0A1M6BWD6_9FIRM|nr:hypothetical protein [Anaerovibrio lipolyticus]SHI53065.1 hypothetical protein SAMN02745671_00877 [Anaerovibrio lipolyticus DSM 3074]
MKDMIKIAAGFQNSVNLVYDLHHMEKIENYIPANAALDFIEDVIKSTDDNGTERARVLIGPYGKGKSHMVLALLSLLLKKDLNKFIHLLPKLEERANLKILIDGYYESNKKLLPVIISGSSSSISQAFLLALERTLKDEDLLNVMPETNYKAAVRCINKWQTEFPDTYQQFVNGIKSTGQDFIERLESFDITAYEEFEKIYPNLTAGSVFNPFLGFDVAELYESVLKSIKQKGYTGLFVVYDEFSKFLEANIKAASVSDTKQLQDFAEKCNRSGKEQMHLLLISHKEIANYIDQLPKQKTDGWRGVSERFKHTHFSDEYIQTYEIIDTVIQKDQVKWQKFVKKNNSVFAELEKTYKDHEMFRDIPVDNVLNVLQGAYPLHPSSLFILPRLSERVAQNERTLFTFLSANSHNTLQEYLKLHSDEKFFLITPDYIYDYFQPLLEKEVNTGTIGKNYELAKNILPKISDSEIQPKIVKILAMIYMLEQYDALPPTKEEIQHILEKDYTLSEIDRAIDDLIAKEYVIYLKRSNGYLCLKKASGINIYAQISNGKEANAHADIKEILNTLNFDRYMYPSRYNDDKEMTRFFAVEFINASDVTDEVNWHIKSENIPADGVIYAVLGESEEEIEIAKDIIESSTQNAERIIFALPHQYLSIRDKIIELHVVHQLREAAVGDEVLYGEYDLIYDDLYAMVKDFLQGYTRPENKTVSFYYLGEKQKFYRKSQLSELMSNICHKIYSDTPVINNEVINKNEITSTALNSLHKVLTAILRKDVESELGLSGFGQEVSIMRSTIMNTGLLSNNDDVWTLNKFSADEKINGVMKTIYSFIDGAGTGNPKSFNELYQKLMGPIGKIGLRRGVIPIYIAVALHIYQGRIIIYDEKTPVDISADILQQINVEPEKFYLERIDWSEDKEKYIKGLEDIFADYIPAAATNGDLFEHVARGMYGWYLSLPKYAKELTVTVSGNTVKREYLQIIKNIKGMQSANDLLFQKIPRSVGIDISKNNELIQLINDAKRLFDEAVPTLIQAIGGYLRQTFGKSQPKRASLQSIMLDWCETLPNGVLEESFADGTEKFLELCQQEDFSEADWLLHIARMTTGLRFNDWDKNTFSLFSERVSQYKLSAENFVAKPFNDADSDELQEGFEFSFVNDKGKTQRRRFATVDYSPRAKLLLNSIEANIDAMGQSISEQEKRQVLAEILKKLC